MTDNVASGDRCAVLLFSEMKKCTGVTGLGVCESCLCWLVSEGKPLAAGYRRGEGDWESNLGHVFFEGT